MKGTDDKHVNKRSYLETVFGGVLVRICGGKEQLQRNTQQGTTLIVKVSLIFMFLLLTCDFTMESY